MAEYRFQLKYVQRIQFTDMYNHKLSQPTYTSNLDLALRSLLQKCKIKLRNLPGSDSAPPCGDLCVYSRVVVIDVFKHSTEHTLRPPPKTSRTVEYDAQLCGLTCMEDGIMSGRMDYRVKLHVANLAVTSVTDRPKCTTRCTGAIPDNCV